MKKRLPQFIVILCLVFTGVQSHAQQESIDVRRVLDSLLKNGYEIVKEDSVGRHFIIVQKPASFPGGIQAWGDYLRKNVNYDLAGKYIRMKKTDSLVKQTISVTFIVDERGDITNVKAEPPARGVEQHPKLAAEAVRAVAEGPRWEPAQMETFEVLDGKIIYDRLRGKNGRGFKKVIYRHKQNITFSVAQ